jgi:hypothetical protein
VFCTYSQYARGLESTGGSSSTSPPSVGKRTGRNPRDAASPPGPPRPTSPHDHLVRAASGAPRLIPCPAAPRHPARA